LGREGEVVLETIVDRDGGFAFGEARYPRGGVYGPLQRPYAMVLFLYDGEAEISCDGLSHPLRAGHAALVRNRACLEIRYMRGVMTWASWCEASPSGEILRDGQILSEPIIVETSKRLAELQRTALDLGDGNSLPENVFRDALGQSVFAALLLEAHRGGAPAAAPARIALARDVLRKGFQDPWTGAALAVRCGLTREHLTSAFRKHYGVTPSRYLWRLRAAAGRRLLLETAWSIDAIAADCGYKSPFHFSRQIKAIYGSSPTEIRALRGYRHPSDVAEQVSDVLF